MYNLFLDDNRNPEDVVSYMHSRIGQLNPLYMAEGWLIAKNFDEFIKIIENNGLPEKISFDHDLAFEHYESDDLTDLHGIPYDSYKEKTGLHALKWLVDLHMDMGGGDFPLCILHTQNPTGYENMRSYIVSYYRQILINIRRNALFEKIYNVY